MRLKIQLTIISPEDGTEVTEEITVLQKQTNQLENIGLTLEESKTVLKALQGKIVQYQTNDFIQTKRACGHCKKARRKKGSYPTVFRTLFGDVSIDSPRFYSCRCEEQQKTFSPLTELMTEHTSPERLYLETKWATLLPFDKTVELLKDVLPMNHRLNAASVRNHLIRVAEREEAELGEEQVMFIDGSQRDWDNLPRPEGIIVVGLDGAYLRSWEDKKKCFEVIAGKSIPSDRAEKFFAFVQTHQASKPKRRLFETLKSQGLQSNQSLEFLSDGATNLQELQKYLSPLSEHYLDWFHITMRITVLHQYLKGMIKVDKKTAEQYQQYLEKTKWYLWHGNLPKALYYLEYFEDTESIKNKYEYLAAFKKCAGEFAVYIQNNRHYITNYGERQRNKEVYTSSFVESTVNALVAKRFCKRQQMQWTKKGAHLMLQARTKVLNDELVDCFKKWYPSLTIGKKYSKKQRKIAA